jgi:A/G-specific adenine glycosylase
MKLTTQQITDFQETVWDYFRSHERSMPWRDDPSAYRVLVSELMLQQTQVSRVITKFDEFMTRFPDIVSLANAPLADVLVVWSGLGYNRRAKFLHESAKKIVTDYDGALPATHDELVSLPGVGTNTAGAIMTYAYNQPVVYIETNIRTVLFHHFYSDNACKVGDKELRVLSEQLLDRDHPREWYWALMDYGTHLKKTAGGRLDSSKHYKKQSALVGSLREMRGRILKVLIAGSLTSAELLKAVKADERYDTALNGLMADGMIEQSHERISLTGHRDTR